MKFSWKLINYFIDVKYIKPEELKEKLILSGIEVEEIKSIKNIEDIIFDVSLTSNRREIYSIIGLAKEIGIIINSQLKIAPINYLTTLNQPKTKDLKIDKLFKVCINEINNLQINITPKWISNYLKNYDIKNLNIIESIQKYIEIKWGQTFCIVNKNQLLSRINLIDPSESIINNIICKYITLNYNDSSQFLLFTKYNSKNTQEDIINNSNLEYYFNGYIDTIQTLSTFTKCKVGKIYYIFKESNENKHQKVIEVNKETLNSTLGKIRNRNFKYISHSTILSTLHRLHLSPRYNQLSKTFFVRSPQARNHDLNRQIDIIEEVGRIEGFHSFLNQLHKNNKKGNISKISIKVKIIRKVLRQLGLNEVINCCLINNNLKNNSIQIYNPLTQEQLELRNNILQNLINNYIYHSKKNNHDHKVEIFEIGKIFQIELDNSYAEEIHVGGLISNKNFIRENWSTKSLDGNFFHFKGFIEILLEQLNARVDLRKVEKYTETLSEHKNFFHHIKQIGIYKKNNKELIGILGEINPIYKKEMNIISNKVYLFEININKLKTSINLNNHLNYAIEAYSSYPNVTRDISVKIDKKGSIKSIEKVLSKNNNPLIQSIKIFNEYLDKKSNVRSISLRIKYASKERTLNTVDIKTIDKEINHLLSRFKSKT